MENLTPEDIDVLKQQMLVDALLSKHPAKAPEGYQRPAELTNPNSPRDDAIAQLMGPLAGEYSRKFDDTVSSIPDAAWSAMGGDMMEQGAKDSVKGFNEGDVSLAAKGTAQMLLPAAMPTRAFLPALGLTGALDLNEEGAFDFDKAQASDAQGMLEQGLNWGKEHGPTALGYAAPILGGALGGRMAKDAAQKTVNKAGQEAADFFKASQNASKAEKMHHKYPDHYGDINQRLSNSLPNNMKKLDGNELHSSSLRAKGGTAQDKYDAAESLINNDRTAVGAVGGATAGGVVDQVNGEGYDSERAGNVAVDVLTGALSGRLGTGKNKYKKSFTPKVKDINARGFRKPKNDTLNEALEKNTIPEFKLKTETNKKLDANYRREKANMQNRDGRGNFIKGYKSDD